MPAGEQDAGSQLCSHTHVAVRQGGGEHLLQFPPGKSYGDWWGGT